tara:strand:+ start:216 stop:734 length:519 start_codon:yes stop_codon:yes gene_type:complete
MIDIKENFLPKDKFEEIQAKLLGENFYWSLANEIVSKIPELGATCEEIYNWQLIHNFYETPATISQDINILNPIMSIINPRILIRIKANLTPRAEKIIEHGLHCDVEPPLSNATTSILYLNTNNGYTAFKDGTKIPSVANTFVSFPSNLKHTGSTCTNVKFRGLINFNYINK